MQQRGEIAADIGIEAGLLDQRRGNGGVAAGRRENHGPLGRCAGLHDSSP
jgi:hypothetical protein